jgi:hypothetical protein
LGFKKIILSKEKFCLFDIQDRSGLFMHDGTREKLIYFKHCPMKEHFASDCAKCKYCRGVAYSLSGKEYELKRLKLRSCLFYLQSKTKNYRHINGFGKIVE